MKSFTLLRFISALFVALSILPISTVLAATGSKLDSADALRKIYGLDQLIKNQKPIQNIKIAIIDNGFAGAENAGAYLPNSAKLVSEYSQDFLTKYSEQYGLGESLISNPPDMQNDHGRRIAQIVWAMTGSHPDGPQFLLLNGNGITNFKRAVVYAMDQQVDLVLYSQVWECCGNFEGSGYINDLVTTATNSGIIWINAAGNFRGYVYNGPVDITEGESKWLTFKNGTNSLKFTNRLDDNNVKVVVSWTAESNDDDKVGTTKNLDVYINDESGNNVGYSNKLQVQAFSEDAQQKAKETKVAREAAVAQNLAKNNPGKFYEIKIFAQGFDATKGKMRVTLVSEGKETYDPAQKKLVPAITFNDATYDGEVMVPADNVNVITVGEVSQMMVQMVGAEKNIVKPDVIMDISKAVFTDGMTYEGSSYAAAYFAGIVAAMKTENSALTTSNIMTLIKRDKTLVQPAVAEAQPVTTTRVVYTEPSWINRALYPSRSGMTTQVITNDWNLKSNANVNNSSSQNIVDYRIWKTPTPGEIESFSNNQ
jgi:hypothetical protein